MLIRFKAKCMERSLSVHAVKRLLSKRDRGKNQLALRIRWLEWLWIHTSRRNLGSSQFSGFKALYESKYGKGSWRLKLRRRMVSNLQDTMYIHNFSSMEGILLEECCLRAAQQQCRRLFGRIEADILHIFWSFSNKRSCWVNETTVIKSIFRYEIPNTCPFMYLGNIVNNWHTLRVKVDWFNKNRKINRTSIWLMTQTK